MRKTSRDGNTVPNYPPKLEVDGDMDGVVKCSHGQ